MFHVINPHTSSFLGPPTLRGQLWQQLHCHLHPVQALIPFLWPHQGPHPKASKTNSPDNFLQKVSRPDSSSSFPTSSLTGRALYQGASSPTWLIQVIPRLRKESWGNSLGSAGNIWLTWYCFNSWRYTFVNHSFIPTRKYSHTKSSNPMKCMILRWRDNRLG